MKGRVWPVIRILVALAVAVSAYSADAAGTMIADALDWYATWCGPTAGPPAAQTCRGEGYGMGYAFRCDPMAVVVQVTLDDAGRCAMTAMGAPVDAKDGLRRTLPMAGLPDPKPAVRLKCGELPLPEGLFEIVVTPHSREVNHALTVRARDAALAYRRGSSARFGPTCVLHFPNIKSGDPFFHVYEECGGLVEAVWEFPIHNREPDSHPHWTYTPQRGGVPDVSRSPLDRSDLWFGTFPLGP